MLKIKHQRSAGCVVAGFRWHKSTTEGEPEVFDDGGRLHHVGITSSFTMDVRRSLAKELAPWRRNALARHPWRDWATASDGGATAQRMPGATSRWSAGKDLSVALRPERVCEVRYDHLQGDRFRHATAFLRWRPDKSPEACRYDQLEVVPPFALQRIFGGLAPAAV